MATNRTLRPVPSTTGDQTPQRTETEEKLWQALRTSPGSTVTALSVAAGIGKSTARKILSRWLKGGLVAQTSGIADGGSRSVDRWSIATDDQLTEERSTDQPSDDELTPESSSGDQPTDELQPDEQAIDDQTTDDQPAGDSSATGPGKPERLAPGGLRGLVEDFLRDNDGEFSPNAVGKSLERSAGAVHNALERLVEAGTAVRTSDKPKKYALAPAK